MAVKEFLTERYTRASRANRVRTVLACQENNFRKIMSSSRITGNGHLQDEVYLRMIQEADSYFEASTHLGGLVQYPSHGMGGGPCYEDNEALQKHNRGALFLYLASRIADRSMTEMEYTALNSKSIEDITHALTKTADWNSYSGIVVPQKGYVDKLLS